MKLTQAKFRQLMGRFATGITVISVQTEDGTVDAMTANAVTAVSLEPMLLLCCIRNESRFLPQLLASGKFSVNILSASQSDISSHYGGKRQDISPAVWEVDAHGIPVLHGANASFLCKVHSTNEVGDHTVVFGEVINMNATEQPQPALIFAAGRYHDLALCA